ncbi:hypothetical protein N658DRAFT_502326 [Parathielavia hyrcaniae]|uniref:Uncharacterized protein n=1 Tax=Parathielavia hyrcaniae TaxID=113614 RepID=A0AAN6PQA6_9PEZI|nr:hypothetical protein N658DRAFT_502326 [Parathielavia hyrcaniae]
MVFPELANGVSFEDFDHAIKNHPVCSRLDRHCILPPKSENQTNPKQCSTTSPRSKKKETKNTPSPSS